MPGFVAAVYPLRRRRDEGYVLESAVVIVEKRKNWAQFVATAMSSQPSFVEIVEDDAHALCFGLVHAGRLADGSGEGASPLSVYSFNFLAEIVCRELQ